MIGAFSFFFNTGLTTWLMLLHSPMAEMITVPGEITLLPSLYFWVIDRLSFPVGTLIPKEIAKSLIPFTASYKRASSPLFLHGHIQLALKETPFKLFEIGAKTMFVKASAMEFREPATGSINALTGA